MTIAVRPLGPAELLAARSLLARACAFDEAGAVAEEKLFGDAAGVDRAAQRAIAAEADGRLAGVAVASAAWVRLLAVDPDLRGRGVGSALLDAAEEAIAAGGAARARAMDQPGNYLAPGIALENADTIAWLERRGWTRGRENTNLLISLDGNPKVSGERAAELRERAEADGYRVRRATLDDLDALDDAIRGEFSAGWSFEVARAIAHPPGAVHAAFDRDGAPAAFAAHDGNNRGLGWFGPAGTFPDHRGRGLGAALLIACLLDVAAAGRAVATIAWIGPREFYDRVAGVAAERRFAVLTKEVSVR